MNDRQIKNEAGEKVLYEGGILQSMWPGRLAFTRGHWIHFVPWWKPNKVLILGYGWGTMSRVLRRVWGDDVIITGVDRNKSEHSEADDEIFTEDAFEFVKKYPKENAFDFIMIDVYDGDKPAPFVFDPEFIKHCVRITSDVVAINLIDEPRKPINYDRAMDHKITKIIERNYLYFYAKRKKD